MGGREEIQQIPPHTAPSTRPFPGELKPYMLINCRYKCLMSSFQQESNVQTTTENAQEDPSVLTDSAQNQPQHSLLVPTIPPKTSSDISKGAPVEPTTQSKQQPNSRAHFWRNTRAPATRKRTRTRTVC